MIISYLKKTIDRINDKFGAGFFTVFGICGFLFILCGLAIGVLGRGWLYAWLLVVLGFIFAIFPILNFYFEYTNEHIPEGGRVLTLSEEEARERREALFSELGAEDRKRTENIKKGEVVDEATKAALELEAAIAKARIQKEKERQRALLEEELRYEANRAAYLARKERQIKEAYEREAKRAEQERKRLEEQRKRQKEFNENYFKGGNIKKAALSEGYFKGVSNSVELKKRYKDLMKIYHPDNTAGDADVMRKITDEYEELYRFYQAYDRH